jgi:hypothetical protein
MEEYPAMERAIVKQQSYGRQLGHVIDALGALIDESKDIDKSLSPFKEFLETRRDIEKIKRETADARFERDI